MKEKGIFIIIVLTLSIPLVITYSQLSNGFGAYEVIPPYGYFLVGHRDALLSEYLVTSAIWGILILLVFSGFFEEKDIVRIKGKLCK